MAWTISTERRASSVRTKHEPYWWETEAVVPGPPLRGERRCDVCIIGAGYTGLWTAHQLKRADPGLDIHIVDAHYAGAGASGHADGFITPTIGQSLHGVVDGFGFERARIAYSVVARSIVEIQRFCRKNGIDAELETGGYYQVASSRRQVRLLERDVRLVERLNPNASMDVLGPNEARDRIGSPAIHAAFKVGGALVNPHRLVRGLSRVVREQGVSIHEQTPATKVERRGTHHLVTTPDGSVTADKVVIATNAYQHRFAHFRDSVKPCWSYAAVTEPLTQHQLDAVHWPGREGFVEARDLVLFGRLTKQNRLLIGGGPLAYRYGRKMDPARYSVNRSAINVLRRTMGRYFPPWRDLLFSHGYGGCIAVTRDLIPHVGTDGAGVYYGYGYCGNGTALTHTVGKVLRDLVLERDTTFTNLLFVGRQEHHFPRSEPLSFLGVRGVSGLFALRDQYRALR